MDLDRSVKLRHPDQRKYSTYLSITLVKIPSYHDYIRSKLENLKKNPTTGLRQPPSVDPSKRATESSLRRHSSHSKCSRQSRKSQQKEFPEDCQKEVG